MIKSILYPSISEEILGAYLEGNLSEDETRLIDSMLEYDNELDGLVDELRIEDLDFADAETIPNIYDDYPYFGTEFELPEVESSFEDESFVACFASPHVSWDDDNDFEICADVPSDESIWDISIDNNYNDSSSDENLNEFDNSII